jgi:putative FmdB family regulatory protein
MPKYDYQCSKCNIIVTDFYKLMCDPHPTTCPECGKQSLEHIIGEVQFMVYGEPTTLGHLAERNTAKMSKEELEERTEAANATKEGRRRVKREMLRQSGNLPAGASIPEPSKQEAWYGKMTKEVEQKVNSSGKAAAKYIMEGKV